MYEYLEIVKSMINITGSEQDAFVNNYVMLAITALYEMGISKKFLATEEAASIIAMYIINVIDEAGNLPKSLEIILTSLKANHPHSEDNTNV